MVFQPIQFTFLTPFQRHVDENKVIQSQMKWSILDPNIWKGEIRKKQQP